MQRTVEVRGLTIGAGCPKICMPIVAENGAALAAGIDEALRLRPDLVEWRADSFAPLDEQSLIQALQQLRGGLGGIPLLFTLRMPEEGGAAPLDEQRRLSLIRHALQTGLCNLVDIELEAGEAATRAVIQAAHTHGAAVVMSNHHFRDTPDAAAMLATLLRQQAAGADVAKLAVMPGSPADVLAVLTASEHARCELGIPFLLIAMGRLGLVSRTCGGVFGSCMTFGAGEHASAPGQVPVDELRAALHLIHGA